MAALAFKVNGSFVEKVLDGTIDVDTDSFRAVLVTNSYSPSQGVHDDWQDASANEISGTGYTANGVAVTLTISRSSLTVTVDASQASAAWTTTTLSNAKYLMIVRDANADNALAATDLIVGYSDLDDGGTGLNTSAGDLTVTYNASGIFQAVAA